jgi:hypothetical protein
MHLALRSLVSHAGFAVMACLALSVAFAPEAFADGAFISQATVSAKAAGVALPIPASPSSTTGSPAFTPHVGSTRATPELATPALASGGNFASTLEIGNYNKVFQAQLGAGNVSNVGIIKGTANKVGVLQAGNNLTSNLALINTQGMSVGVIQPNGSAPVNMLIARLPNGGLLIKR